MLEMPYHRRPAMARTALRLLFVSLLVLAVWPATPASAVSATVLEPSVLLRSGPGVNYRAIDKLARGEILQVLEQDGNWYRVNRYGVTGWVYKSLLSQPSGAVPVRKPAVPAEKPVPQEPEPESEAVVEILPRIENAPALPAEAKDNILRTSRGDVVVDLYQPGTSYEATIVTTKGTIRVQLWHDVAPNHVKNFLHLSATDYYDGLTIHRIVSDFLIQGGDPKGDGTGGPGYSIPLEVNDRRHLPGTLSMARRVNDPDSAGSQFFILLDEHQFLDGKYTPFGKVVEGMEVVRQLAKVPTNDWDQPLDRVEILDVRIRNLADDSVS